MMLKLTANLMNNDSSEVLSYGIVAVEDKNILLKIKNISTKKSFVVDLLDKINRNNVSLSHVKDVVEDALP